MLRAPTAALAVALPLAVCAAHAQDGPVTEARDLRIARAWTNAGAEETAEVYMTIENTGDEPATLTGAEPRGFRIATVVDAPGEALDAVPETLDGLLLPAGYEIALVPGGLHLLLTGVDAPREEGDQMNLTLLFEPQGAVEVPVQVEAADATQHSGAD